MDYEYKIKLLENQLIQLQTAKPPDNEKISQVLDELRRLRRAEYEESQRVNFDDDR